MQKMLLALSIGLACNPVLADEAPGIDEIWEIIKAQREEIASLKKQMQKNNSQIQETKIITSSVVDALDKGVATSSASAALSWAEKTSIGGYGEHHYNLVDEGSDQIDAHRYVLYAGHAFTDTIRFFSELELEHSLAGDGRPGEVELEQAFIEWQFNRNHKAIIGQYLVPVGILNETHEPDTFYGVERNNVEKEVIPATWWETGAMISGSIAEGFNYDVAIHSGLNLADGNGGIDTFRIRSGRQKSAEANANNLAYTARFSYSGIRGLKLSATLQHQTDLLQSVVPGDEASATLFAVQTVYQGENFGLRALYAGWDIDNTGFAASESDSPDGWFVEPSYKITESLGIFARYSEVDPARGDRPTRKTEQYDLGLNYWLTPQTVLKADYQNHREDGSDAVNLGLGWSF